MTCPHLHVADLIEGALCLGCGAILTCRWCGLPAIEGEDVCAACYEPEESEEQ